MKIVLRPITQNDGELIVKWRNNVNVLNHCMTRKPISLDSHNSFYKNNILTGKYIQFIVEKIDDDFGVVAYPIATVYLKDVDYINKRCELCIFTSDDFEWEEESQSIAIKLLLEKAIKDYGMNKIYSYAFYKYQDEINLLKKAGFSIEAILKKEAMNDNGEFEDIVRLCYINN